MSLWVHLGCQLTSCEILQGQKGQTRLDSKLLCQDLGKGLKYNKNLLDYLNFFLASGDFYCLLITFANSLDPDQDQQNVGPDLDSYCLTP